MILELDWILQVVTPTGNVLVEHLTLRVESGSNLLITGMSFPLIIVTYLVICLLGY